MASLRVEAANCITRRTRLVVLEELAVNTAARVLFPAKGLEEKSTPIPEQVRFNDHDGRQLGWNEVHDRLGLLLQNAQQVLSVVAVGHRVSDPYDIAFRDVSHAPGDFFQAGNL